MLDAWAARPSSPENTWWTYCCSALPQASSQKPEEFSLEANLGHKGLALVWAASNGPKRLFHTTETKALLYILLILYMILTIKLEVGAAVY